MKSILIIILILVGLYDSRLVNAEITANHFHSAAETRKKSLATEGVAYMAGGGVGLILSVAGGLTYSSILSQVGYGIFQGLSFTSMAYGASILFGGDDLVRESERLRDLESILQKKGYSQKEQSAIVDRAAAVSFERYLISRRKLRRVRGILEGASTVSSAIGLFSAKEPSLIQTVSLGFIGSASLVGCILDLFFDWDSKNVESYKLSFQILPNGKEPSGNAPMKYPSGGLLVAQFVF